MPNQFELTCFEGDPPFVCVCWKETALGLRACLPLSQPCRAARLSLGPVALLCPTYTQACSVLMVGEHV